MFKIAQALRKAVQQTFAWLDFLPGAQKTRASCDYFFSVMVFLASILVQH